VCSSDLDGQEAWIDNYCAQNPLDNLSGAAQALVAELRKRAAQ
jgi:hypothetical protein